MLTRHHRQDYAGEYVVLAVDIHHGIRNQTREWVDNRVTINQISRSAAVIGSDCTRHRFDYKLLENHRGGLNGTTKLHTYGTGNIWRQMQLETYVSTRAIEIAQLYKTDYAEQAVVYSTSRQCLHYPNQLHLIPYQPNLHDLALPVYLAAFDGRTNIYMLGYNKETPCTDPRWIDDVAEVIKAYSYAQFTLVGVESNMPAAWRNRPNVACMDYATFVTHCDI